MTTIVAPTAEIDRLANQCVDAAFKVHNKLGPGLLESVYEKCLIYELENRSIQLESQVGLPIAYENHKIEHGLRLDLLVDKKIIIETKAVNELLPIHMAQLITYLKLSEVKLGLLINFNVTRIKNGIKRIVL